MNTNLRLILALTSSLFFWPGTSALALSAELHQEVRSFSLPAGAIHAILFSPALSPQDFAVQEAADAQVHVHVTVVADMKSREQGRLAAAELVVLQEDGHLTVSEPIFATSRCQLLRVNQELRVKGACYAKVRVAIPANSNIAVYAGARQVYGSDNPIQSTTLVKLIESQRTKAQALIDDFVRRSDPQSELRAAELEHILTEISFRAPQLKALEKLAPFLKRASERLAFHEAIDRIFSYSGDQKRAAEILKQN